MLFFVTPPLLNFLHAVYFKISSSFILWDERSSLTFRLLQRRMYVNGMKVCGLISYTSKIEGQGKKSWKFNYRMHERGRKKKEISKRPLTGKKLIPPTRALIIRYVSSNRMVRRQVNRRDRKKKTRAVSACRFGGTSIYMISKFRARATVTRLKSAYRKFFFFFGFVLVFFFFRGNSAA